MDNTVIGADKVAFCSPDRDNGWQMHTNADNKYRQIRHNLEKRNSRIGRFLQKAFSHELGPPPLTEPRDDEESDTEGDCIDLSIPRAPSVGGIVIQPVHNEPDPPTEIERPRSDDMFTRRPSFSRTYKKPKLCRKTSPQTEDANIKTENANINDGAMPAVTTSLSSTYTLPEQRANAGVFMKDSKLEWDNVPNIVVPLKTALLETDPEDISLTQRHIGPFYPTFTKHALNDDVNNTPPCHEYHYGAQEVNSPCVPPTALTPGPFLSHIAWQPQCSGTSDNMCQQMV